jgi:hypothetical protein
MTLYRVTENDNPSNRFVEEFEGVSVVDGRWVFLLDGVPAPAQALGAHGISDYTVEIEQQGGIWQKLEPESPLPR